MEYNVSTLLTPRSTCSLRLLEPLFRGAYRALAAVAAASLASV